MFYKFCMVVMALFSSGFVSANEDRLLKLPEKIASSQWTQELLVAYEAAYRAGQVLYEIQHSEENLQIEQKSGYQGYLSPVTIADAKANDIICSLLNARFPGYGLLTEENTSDEHLQSAVNNWRTLETTWIIDPLDGTRAFINKDKGYGIHIGLTYQGRAILA